MFTWSRFSAFAALFICATPMVAQTLIVGFNNPYYGGNVSPSATQTTLELFPASLPGEVTSATFGWSASPCPAAVKIKFFRLWGAINVFHPLYTFLTERGPFDVTQPAQTSLGYPPAIQTVNLIPPVSLQKGDVIAITTCGGPTYVANLPPPLPPNQDSSLTVPGDASGDIFRVPLGRPVFVAATGTTQVLPLLNGRFHVTMVATDPRTGTTAVGMPNRADNLARRDGAGYFSLPDFTGDPQFPEVTVKMVDATRSPAPGGGFWFFYAPLTDVQYTLTVSDQVSGKIRTYSNIPGGPGQLCGGADTSAFPGP